MCGSGKRTEAATCSSSYFRNDVGERGRKMKMKVLLRLLVRSRCPLRCLPTEACVCVHASVPCSVDKPVDRTLIQHGEEDNLLDVSIIVSKRGQRSREELVESVVRESVYFGNCISRNNFNGWSPSWLALFGESSRI